MTKPFENENKSRSEIGDELTIENNLARIVVNSALIVHKSMGPGLLESTYQECLAYELFQEGLSIRKEVPMPLVYKGVSLDCGYRIDILVEEKLVVEIKSVETLIDVHAAQVLTYLKLSGCRLGLLINFNVALLKDGIRRLIL